METTITAKQIHADFYGAEERLYIGANGLLRNSKAKKRVNNFERYDNLGFGSCKNAESAKATKRKFDEAKDIKDAIDYYRVYYPNNKFITEEEVRVLCKKYSLFLGNSKNYIGEIPDKNLEAIEKFVFRKEDWYKDYHDMIREMMTLSWILPYTEKEKKKEEKEETKPLFKICASKDDFNLQGYEVVDGYKLVYDPIVLQPVKYNNLIGFLIVDAWGDEANDEIVVNQNKN